MNYGIGKEVTGTRALGFSLNTREARLAIDPLPYDTVSDSWRRFQTDFIECKCHLIPASVY